MRKATKIEEKKCNEKRGEARIEEKRKMVREKEGKKELKGFKYRCNNVTTNTIHIEFLHKI